MITEDGDTLVFNGRKTFSTGSKVSDLTVLEGVLEGTDQHIFAIVPSAQDGIVFADDWDNIGQRLTESGSVRITNVRISWDDAAGYVNREFRPLVYNTLNLPAIQLVFTNLYLGIAQGALETAAAYTRSTTRPWPYGRDNKESAVDEWYILEAYGDLQSKLWSVEALTDQVGTQLSQILHGDREAVTARQRGEIAVRVAAAKQRAIDVGLEVTSRIFEVTGARAPHRRWGSTGSGATCALTACTTQWPTSGAKWDATRCSTRSLNPPGTPDPFPYGVRPALRPDASAAALQRTVAHPGLAHHKEDPR